jgi:spherulation-specific family 4 protein
MIGNPLRIAVPAFWTLEQKYQQYWQALRQAGSMVSITVIEGSWPAAARNNATWRSQARSHLDTLPGAILGYVGTRDANGALLAASEILTGPNKVDSVQAWYDQFGQNIDGIYFDELVIPEDSGAVNAAQMLLAQFKASHPTAKAMILAGQCPDEGVVGPDIDWALLWEDRDAATRKFAARVGVNLQPIPPWWKNPRYRQKIVHVVHDCVESNRQYVLGLALERNAGHVFVMGRRGLNQSGAPVLYDHLPPYWDVEVREVNSYYDFGLVPRMALLAAGRYGASQSKIHAWPNFEAAWYTSGHVRGTFLLDAGPHATRRDVLRADLPGTPELFDIPALWSAAHQYARSQNPPYETALPTFEQIETPNGVAFSIILFATNLPWLSLQTVSITSTYQQPTFAEPGAVIRNINRWANSNGYKASFPTFVTDNAANPRGVTNFYNCYVISSSAPVSWQDIPTSAYLQQL